MSSTSRIHFSVAFPDTPAPLEAVWEAIIGFLRTTSCLPKRFEANQLIGHLEQDQSRHCIELPPSEISELISERKLDGFWVYSGKSGRHLDFCILNGKQADNLASLGCYVERDAKAPNNWVPLIEGLMNRFQTVGAWQWHELYQGWQRIFRADTGYESRWGTLPSGYRKWHEPGLTVGDPGKTFIDIAKNPGRPKGLATRVNFYPTADMWLGPHFWQYAKCTKEDALAADFFIEKRDTPHFTYFKCWPTAFTRPDGEQGRMQQRLWQLFFHEDCEWPPGSGTICDEPMYGPPELMPDYKRPTDG
jgi:hypothetical protein